MATEGGGTRISQSEIHQILESHPPRAERSPANLPHILRTRALLKGAFSMSPAGAAPLQPAGPGAQEGSQGCN